MYKSLIRLSRILTIVIPAIVLPGCFGEGNGPTSIPGTLPPPPTPLVGILVNSSVEGADFVTKTRSGVTNAAGEFKYLPGEKVSFSVGGIVLGTVAGAQIVTPVELTGSADPTVPAATNLLRFLQSIDEDSNHANGILINAATRAMAASLTLDFTSATDAEVDTVIMMLTGNTPVDAATALDNFYETYKSLGGSNTFSWPFPGYPPYPGAGTVDLLTNGDFELPDASAADQSCSASWSCFNQSFTSSNIFTPGGGAVNPAAHSGTQVLKQYGTDAGAFQDVPATPGDTYTASAWAQNWSGDALNNIVLLQLFFYDSAGNNISGGFNAFDQESASPASGAPDTYLPPDTWVQLTASGVAPANAVTARIQMIHVNANVTGNPGGAVFWDDASLTGPGGPPPPPANLLTNDDFELPDASAADQSCSASWSCFNQSFTSSNIFTPGGGAVNPAAHSGTQVLKQYGTDAGAFQDVPATPGDTYTASAWAQNWSGDPLNNIVLLQLFFYDSTGNNISGGFNAFDQESASPASGAPDTYLPPDTWVQLTASGVAPANAVTARIQMIHVNANVTGNPGGAVFWDDASLTGPAGGGTTPPAFPTLVWSDEFNGTALDTSKWSYEVGYGNNGWGNDEWQLYTTDSGNISVAGGNLVISAQCATPPACGRRDGTITSAKINTLNNFNFRFGRIEARIQPAVGIGAWPAFWMLGANFPFVGWPEAGEIDILEVFNNGSNNRTAHFTMHWCDESLGVGCVFPDGYRLSTNFRDTGSSLGSAFHIFEAEWDANGITGKVDGAPYFTSFIQPATMEEFLEDFYMILNVAIGGNLGGAPDNTTVWPQTMLVDYVRVYQ
jgi:beta-glucanase (GH16 family)